MLQVATWVKMVVDAAMNEPAVDGLDGVEERAKEAFSNSLQAATCAADFVAPLLAHMPPATRDLLTTFNSTECGCSGEAQDCFILNAVQGTEVYREMMRAEPFSESRGRCSSTTPAEASAATPVDSGATTVGICVHCTSRHVLSVLTYAILALLHKREMTGDGPGRSKLVWYKDPLEDLSKPVADEALHVAGMLEGLMGMDPAEWTA